MKILKGYFINLEESKERRRNIEEQLKIYNVTDVYERFNAIKGNKRLKKKTHQSLSCGEIGIWKSWLNILEKESKNKNRSYKYLHIIEDDVILNKHFFEFINKLSVESFEFDLLVTDMYVNPSIYRKFSDDYRRLLKTQKYAVSTDFYSGCLSSAIIPATKIEKIYNKMKDYYGNTEEQLIPIDNFIKRLGDNHQITIARTAPFLTSIKTDSIRQSTIQERQCEIEEITISQEICTILRQDFYILNESNTNKKLMDTIVALNECQGDSLNKDRNELTITKKLLEFLGESGMMKYKIQPRLLQEKNNEQAKDCEA